ncbi:MAG TPA: hypothetical protein VFE33_28355 [Thermoanaerobaculia bacterium]|nr:hypothetical protein [Thermoanaerobaculia bacterium]
MGFFDRTAAPELVMALRKAPSIAELTDHIGPQQEARFRKAVARLCQARLVEEAGEPGYLDAHPLVRVYFQEELQRERPKAWQEGNLRLYEYLKKAAPEFPETLETMEPLYAAVVHGCRAGRQQDAMDEVYRRRIQRGNAFYSSGKLGALGSNLTALAGFFARRWDQPSESLAVQWQAFALNDAAFCMRALGRLAEAAQPMQVAMKMRIALEDWAEAAVSASNLSELMLSKGEVEHAVAFGEQSVALADRSGDTFQRISMRTTLADALHQAGRWEESMEAFQQAEAMQAKLKPLYPILYSLRGHRYCDLLLSREEPEDGSALDELAGTSEEARRFRRVCKEVQKRAVQTMKWATQRRFLLDIALDYLSLGRAHLGLALTPGPDTTGERSDADFAKAAEQFDSALRSVRLAGREDDSPRGLLARATLHRLRRDRAAAAADLSQALEIAERGGMRLHVCDAHLEWARLDLQQGNAEAAREHVAAARRLVNETGYKRREREVVWLEGRLKHSGPPPS